jgi:hypothetical protein
LQKIELWSRRIVQCHNFTVNDSTVREIDKRFDYVRVLLIERLLTTGEQSNFVIGLDRNCPISIKFDLFCGVRRYVALSDAGSEGRGTEPPPMPHNSHQKLWLTGSPGMA